MFCWREGGEKSWLFFSSFSFSFSSPLYLTSTPSTPSWQFSLFSFSLVLNTVDTEEYSDVKNLNMDWMINSLNWFRVGQAWHIFNKIRTWSGFFFPFVSPPPSHFMIKQSFISLPFSVAFLLSLSHKHVRMFRLHIILYACCQFSCQLTK